MDVKNGNVKRWVIVQVRRALIGAMATIVVASTGYGFEHHSSGDVSNKSCSQVALAALKASKNEIQDDFWITTGKCINLSDQSLQGMCKDDARKEYSENRMFIKEQYAARLEICSHLGELAYDPVINPEDFVDFELVVAGLTEFTSNPYFPLTPGLKKIYLVRDNSGRKKEKIQVEVLSETKEIMGVNCIVVRDRVWEFDEEGAKVLIEDTEDWFAQDLLGNVWYFGEIAKNYEDGELVNLEGSWKAGREYDIPGIIMWDAPVDGVLYRQEFSLGNAEDMALVDGYVDEMQIKRNIFENVLVTVDFTPIDPGIVEYKYYAPRVGLIKEEKPDDGEVLELVRLYIP